MCGRSGFGVKAILHPELRPAFHRQSVQVDAMCPCAYLSVEFDCSIHDSGCQDSHTAYLETHINIPSYSVILDHAPVPFTKHPCP